jgi:diguanylate cyclase (GGDEF)-like protein
MAMLKNLDSWSLFFLKKNFKVRIILPTVAVLFILIVTLTVFLTLKFFAFGGHLVDDKIAADIASLKLHLDSSRQCSKAAAVSMAADPSAIRAIKNRNRNEIIRLFAPKYELFQVNFFTITDEKGTVIVRVHEPAIYGDSILNQQNVRDALSGKVSSGFEEGSRVKVSIRAGAPVYDTGGRLVGAVIAGVKFDEIEEVDRLKELFGSEFTVFLGNKRIATTVGESDHRALGTSLDPQVEKIVIENKQEHIRDLEILGKKYRGFYMPLIDAQNKVFAVFSLLIPMEKLIAETSQSIEYGAIIGTIGLIASSLLMFFIISSISAPIVALSKDMENLADGNLDIVVDARGEDEIGVLGRSLKKVIDTVHVLIDGIVAMIAEHNKGNTSYRLDTEAFHGYFKILADQILVLADTSMNDQLTAIPNRRSFNNRLELEWNRAKREKTNLSLMIIDVDKFKNYNDSFGHQQGDEALKAVASVLKQCVNRAADLAARWGGEEFVVLLPNTDSNGAVKVAEKIRTGIENTEITCTDPKAVKVTASIGVNTQVPSSDSSIENFIAITDGMLYRAKETGRNRVIISVDTSKAM